MAGKQLQKISLESYQTKSFDKILRILLIFGVGMLAYALHFRLKNPLGIPGHHGIVFIGLFMATKLSSNMRYAGSIASLGIGGLIMLGPSGIVDPLRIFYYMLPGICLDVFFNIHSFKKQSQATILSVAVIGGLAYLTIPVSRFIVTAITGIPYPSLIKNGWIAPIAGFFFFGLIGGLAGKGINLIEKKFK